MENFSPKYSSVQHLPTYLEDDVFILNLFESINFRDDLMLLMQKVIARLDTMTETSSLLNIIIQVIVVICDFKYSC